jgi:hypothetical protein
MRFFSKEEIDQLLVNSGFELLALGAFPDLSRPPDDSTWNVIGVARRS